jgi:hypothetical protein
MGLFKEANKALNGKSNNLQKVECQRIRKENQQREGI